MAETRAQWGSMISAPQNGSDTSPQSESLVFGKDLPSTPGMRRVVEGNEGIESEAKSSAELQAEIDATRAHLDDVVDELEARVEDKVETVRHAKRAIDPRRLLKAHPIAAAALGLSVIGLTFVAYRLVRRSLPVRMYLALRLGQWHELFRA